MSDVKEVKFTLVKYRDAGLPTYTFFWVNNKNHIISPYFDTESEADEWLNTKLYRAIT